MTTSQQYGVSSVPPRRASGGVIALGVINIIYSISFRLCCGVGALLSSLFAAAFTNFLASMPEMEKTQMMPLEMMASGPMRAYSIINGFVMLLLGIMLLCGGIGLLKLKPWGRNLSLGVAAAEIVWVLISFAINIFFVYPLMAQMMGEETAQQPQMIMNVVGGIFSALVSLVYPTVLLIMLNLKSIKEQFGAASAQGW